MVCGSRDLDFANNKERIDNVWLKSSVRRVVISVMEMLSKAAGDNSEWVTFFNENSVSALVVALKNRAGPEENAVVYHQQRGRKRSRHMGLALRIEIPDPYLCKSQQCSEMAPTMNGGVQTTKQDKFWSQTCRVEPSGLNLKMLLFYKCFNDIKNEGINPQQPKNVASLMRRRHVKKNIDIMKVIFEGNPAVFDKAVKSNWTSWKSDKTTEDTLNIVESFSWDLEHEEPLPNLLSKFDGGKGKFNKVMELLQKGISAQLVEVLQNLHDVHSNSRSTNKKRCMERRLEEDYPSGSGKKTKTTNEEAGEFMSSLKQLLANGDDISQ